MVEYNLSHLTQPSDQQAGGPIQDDEALLLFALIRVMRMRRVLEIGGLRGYSARNFIEAVGNGGKVYTVETGSLEPIAPNHIVLAKNAHDVMP